jgi:uncharacterized membrane protein YheB (UPF0754 family)
MGLTITEKEHWKDRIARRIEKRIEAIFAEEPNLEDRIQREARQRALSSLGLSAQQTELDEIEKQKEALEKREQKISKAMLARVRGVSVSDINEYYAYQHDNEISNAVKRRQAVHEDELLAEHERGQEIVRLRQEKEDLLDTVWLATSGAQIKELWSKVAEVLGDQQTQLQREALAIKPESDA